MNRNKKLIAVAAVLIVIAAAVWYFASPVYAMSQLKSAAESGDPSELEERIDFPKVRESVKTQLRAVLAREMAKPEAENAPFGKLGAMMAMGMVDSMVEGFVTPESMSAMIEEGKIQKPGQAPADAAKGRPVDWNIEREGLDKFKATPKTVDGKAAPSFVFERDGLGWKLAGLELPPEATAKN